MHKHGASGRGFGIRSAESLVVGVPRLSRAFGYDPEIHPAARIRFASRDFDLEYGRIYGTIGRERSQFGLGESEGICPAGKKAAFDHYSVHFIQDSIISTDSALPVEYLDIGAERPSGISDPVIVKVAINCCDGHEKRFIDIRFRREIHGIVFARITGQFRVAFRPRKNERVLEINLVDIIDLREFNLELPRIRAGRVEHVPTARIRGIGNPSVVIVVRTKPVGEDFVRIDRCCGVR